MVVVHGDVSPGYEAVREAFAENFRSRGEVGAAVAVVVDNQVVVDLWGGSANPRQGRSWQRDTLINLFSTTKGLSALAAAHAHSRGLFEYDEPVATYWPEFAGQREAPRHRTHAAVSSGGAVRDRHTDDGGDAGRT